MSAQAIKVIDNTIRRPARDLYTMGLFQYYDLRINERQKMDGAKLLSNIKNDIVKVVFFDPQYRGVLDK